MSELPVGSLWRGKWDFNEGMRVILDAHEAHNPPSGVLLITYHDIHDDETRCVMCMRGEWQYEFELVSN